MNNNKYYNIIKNNYFIVNIINYIKNKKCSIDIYNEV